MKNSRPLYPLFCGAMILFISLITNPLSAQNVGIGFQVGDPTAINLQFLNKGGMSVDLLFAYDLDHFFFVNVHGLWYEGIDQSGKLSFYYGPGAFAGFHNDRKREDYHDGVIGFSGDFGLNYRFPRLDLFLQLTPRLSVLPGTGFDMGGGLGLRFLL